MKKKQVRLFGGDCLESTSNNVIIRFKSSNLKRIHRFALDDARKDYMEMINNQGKNPTKRST